METCDPVLLRRAMVTAPVHAGKVGFAARERVGHAELLEGLAELERRLDLEARELLGELAGRVPDFYGDGDDRIIHVKRITATP